MKYVRLILRWFIPLLSAFIIWMMIVSEKDYTIIIDTPIQIYEPRPDKILKNEVPASAQVMFRGSGRNLMYSKYIDPPSLILDVSTITRRYRINLNEYFDKYPNRVVYPRNNIEYLEVVYPESVNVLIDEKVSREIPVHINAAIQTETGYIITQPAEAEPTHTTVTGPRSMIRKYGLIESEAVQLSSVNRSMQQMVGLVNPDPVFLTMEPKQVSFSVRVESIGERIIRDIPVRVVNVPSNLKINIIPPQIAITIVGGNDLIQTVQPEEIELKFDYASQWVPNTYYYSPEVAIPNEVLEWKFLDPEKIEVVVVRK